MSTIYLVIYYYNTISQCIKIRIIIKFAFNLTEYLHWQAILFCIEGDE